ncbi:enoyl-CoA hydratase-related protein [Brevibacterium sp. RIT 803]|uniref:enoyl-CoA hydratase-related protein n=1 Tax=Brevibacterium sp. RIT 803 TaxID=2810210 RepID=UPI0019503711|nr:enoyl-CoA hydratase-related protein [Brevibacterium sp. RIT 803]MBM6590622.1 enoyl-CoA hydratase/isomerase family protein [Brevibacterium sp. RIT 803]
MAQDIVIAQNQGVLTVTLTRTAKKNALTNHMYDELADALERADTDSSIRAVVLRSAGNTFTAGNDIGDFAEQSADKGAASAEEKPVQRYIRALVNSSTPIVAAVQGQAVGIGTTMLLHCDYVLLTEDAQLSTPFVSLALVPEAASSRLLTQRIGHVRAFAMFALGESLDAQSAVLAGVANAIVPAAELHEQAQTIAAKLSAQPAGSLTATKRLMRDVEPTLEQVAAESALFVERLASPEALEAFTAFREKRRPDFAQFS